ncbi:hypothetical protein AMTR_s00008p00232630 [Amborella trichopoda]|uniref:Uncharacterized protein n=1 Tax=Amborella trichopoda TaxID=13333 RepID=W1NHZ3_AMBTC|nr:hypothetical protein AMTR_s00008p00232630 [Amborella trichopoda]
MASQMTSSPPLLLCQDEDDDDDSFGGFNFASPPDPSDEWDSTRRATTKLKQSKVACEFFEANRGLHKELQELRALKLGFAQSA